MCDVARNPLNRFGGGHGGVVARANLVLVAVPPAGDGPFGARTGVGFTARDLFHLLEDELLGNVRVGRAADAQLTQGVVAPAPRRAVHRERARVGATGGNLEDAVHDLGRRADAPLVVDDLRRDTAVADLSHVVEPPAPELVVR